MDHLALLAVAEAPLPAGEYMLPMFAMLTLGCASYPLAPPPAGE